MRRPPWRKPQACRGGRSTRARWRWGDRARPEPGVASRPGPRHAASLDGEQAGEDDAVAETNLQILLRRRPQGEPAPDDFDIREAPAAEPAEGEVLVRARFLSLDPYMRGRMSDAKSYAKPVEIGAVMEGQTAGEVVASRAPGFSP